ncbi:rhomboid family intramembrane serine protease [Brevibacterium litoralis]|uniref:rhomboid family intramembrane serine protease n=1 Tax=Brevibacterium litoralis TaxID=3138935 RepID=UPI0032EDF98E
MVHPDDPHEAPADPRSEAGEPRAPRASSVLQGVPVTTTVLVVLVLAWLVELVPGWDEVSALGFSADRAASDPWRTLTAALVHDTPSPFHLVFNIIGFLVFGGFVERAIGHLRYGLLVLLGAIGGHVAVLVLADPLGASWEATHIGASGAVFALVGFLLVPLPGLDRNWGGVLGFVLLNVLFLFVDRYISWQGHLGGLVTGLVFGFLAVWPSVALERRAAGAGDRAPRARVVFVFALGALVVLFLLAGAYTWRLETTGALLGSLPPVS